MAAKEKKTLSLADCTEIGERLVAGFENAIGDTKKELTPNTRLLVGIRGALDAVRSETDAGWIVRTLGRVLAYKGVAEDAEE